MKKICTILALTLLSLTLTSCEKSIKPASGLEDELYVVADSTEFEALKDVLDSTFEKIIYTPQPEKLFTITRIPPASLEENQNKKNIIIIAPLNSGSTTSQFINAVVDSASKQRLEDDKNFIVTKYNFWAKDQLVMLLTAPTITELQTKILNNKDNLLNLFQKISDKRLNEALYNENYENKDIEGEMLKQYGWIMYVQSDVKMEMNKPEDNFVWLRRGDNKDMERWIFVHWIDNASPAYLNTDSINAIRNRMTEKFYHRPEGNSHMSIAEDYFTTCEINFNGRYAIFTQGLWHNNDRGASGPFINYTFYDPQSGRVYMLDGSIYAPKYYKRNLIQQMDVTLRSFMTKNEVQKDKIADLLKAVESK